MEAFTDIRVIGKNVLQRFSRQEKFSFLSGCILTILTHGYIMANPLFNHDGVVSLHTPTEATSSGRWLLTTAIGLLNHHYQMQWVIGLWTVFLLGGTCMLITRAMGLQSTVGVLLSNALLVTFPTVACTLSYNFTAAAYFLALLMAAAAACLCLRRQWGFVLLGGVLMGASMGIYQAYISVTIVLLMFRALTDLLEDPKNWKQPFFRGLRGVAGIGVGFAVYLVMLRVMCAVRNTSLSGYRGINEMGHYTLEELPGLFGKTYRQVWDFFVKMGTQSYLPSDLVWVQRLLLAVLVAGVVYLAVRSRVYRVWQAAGLCALLVLLAPAAINAMQILNTQDTPHTLMIYSFVLVFVLAVRLCEAIGRDGVRRPAEWCVFLLCACLAVRFFTISNIGYLHLQVSMDTTQSFANRVAMRVEEQPGYGELPVYLSGGYPYYLNNGELEDNFPVTSTMMGLYGDSQVPTAHQLEMYLEDYLRVPLKSPTSEQIEAVKASQEYQDMPVWPAEGSVAVIEDVIVVRLSAD